MLIYRLSFVLIILFVLTLFSLCEKEEDETKEEEKEKTKGKGKGKGKVKTRRRSPVLLLENNLKHHCDLSTIIKSNLSLCDNKVWLARSKPFFSNADLSNRETVLKVTNVNLQTCMERCLIIKTCFAVSTRPEEDKVCYLTKQLHKTKDEETIEELASWTTYELKCCTLNLFSLRTVKGNTQNETIHPMVFNSWGFCETRNIFYPGKLKCTHKLWREYDAVKYFHPNVETIHYDKSFTECLRYCQELNEECDFISINKKEPDLCYHFKGDWKNKDGYKTNELWVSYVRLCCVNQRKGKEVTALPVQPAKIVPVQPATEADRYSAIRKNNPIGHPSENRSLWAWYSALPLIPLVFLIMSCVGVICYCKKKKEKREKADNVGHSSSSEENHLEKVK